jgi:cytochrome b561
MLRNSERGYGSVTKILHWLTVVAIAAQFAVGLTMAADDIDTEQDHIDALIREGEEHAERQGEAAEENFDAEIDRLEDALDVREDNYVTSAFAEPGVSLPEVHVLLGLSIMVLALLRVTWRMTTPLPPWAAHLSQGERRLEGWLEKVLLALLFVVPISGLVLVAAGDDDWLWLHIVAQLTLLTAIALHVGLVLKHTVVHRHAHVQRML